MTLKIRSLVTLLVPVRSRAKAASSDPGNPSHSTNARCSWGRANGNHVQLRGESYRWKFSAYIYLFVWCIFMRDVLVHDGIVDKNIRNRREFPYWRPPQLTGARNLPIRKRLTHLNWVSARHTTGYKKPFRLITTGNGRWFKPSNCPDSTLHFKAPFWF